jgi:hypothetical protein
MPGRLATCVHLAGDRGGIDNMQALESHIGNEQHPAVPIRERNAWELEDVSLSEAGQILDVREGTMKGRHGERARR